MTHNVALNSTATTVSFESDKAPLSLLLFVVLIRISPLMPQVVLPFSCNCFKNPFHASSPDARKLVALCRKIYGVHVNIIEYNPIEGVEFVKTGADRLNSFARYLADHGVEVTVRRSRGKDIDAACGQLANK